MMRREVEKQLRQEEERSSEVRRMPSALCLAIFRALCVPILSRRILIHNEHAVRSEAWAAWADI